MKAAFILFGLLLALASSYAAQSRDELIFSINVALKTNDRKALERCFNFEGVDEKQRAALEASIDQICSWPTRYTLVTDRKDRGPMQLVRDGKPYSMNGDWTFQIHIHKGKPPSKGFVFPAGQLSNGQFAILTIVPK